MYGDMNLEVAIEAIETAEEKGLEAGEQVLLDYYDAEAVNFNLNRMQAIQAFRPRIRLARKALNDYRDERFHACIPVVLALMDGLVQELHATAYGEARALSSEEVELTAWDSIAAHSSGLKNLATLMRKGRKKTRTVNLTVPYRNGIMHGMDLGYDNRVVAAKTWAALFSVREWALKVEHEKIEEPEALEESDDRSFLDSLKRLKKSRETRRQVEQWEPREVLVGEDVPAAAPADRYPEGTPTRALVEFLSYWKDDNYGYMAGALKHISTGGSVDPGRIREEFEHTALHDFRILAVEDFSPAFTDITVELEREIFGKADPATVQVRMTYMKDDGSPAAYGIEEGQWHLTTRLKLRVTGQYDVGEEE